MMRKLTLRRYYANPYIVNTPEGNPWHHDIIAYMGYINLPLRCWQDIDCTNSSLPLPQKVKKRMRWKR
ncbi:hypothetical protein P171DRAFT_157556 [Karstenula rhodostoma CBS 690.94]|uniref:Uncharacterized protein n=1 Tax=Karstenula rhodostoma CBS 690.94 TaxID=1392251 RepID=A0A9P4P7E8_9PLEO|nr:hypothetical protein P171DRAFT_157556 [Karstenula rhodostoma CBS 690.94]